MTLKEYIEVLTEMIPEHGDKIVLTGYTDNSILRDPFIEVSNEGYDDIEYVYLG